MSANSKSGWVRGTQRGGGSKGRKQMQVTAPWLGKPRFPNVVGDSRQADVKR